ncbi:MAG: hypothetical protein MRY57_02100 [Candidatus Pacebacteria bacterium]|nr:hypothetical protein [Candidatus Paceibacterota bacterium]
MKKILYIDMDGVIVDFESGILAISEEERETYAEKYSRCPGIFSKMKPLPGGIEAVNTLKDKYDVYFLSAPNWENSSSWSDKVDWIKCYFPDMEKRLILSHNKNLNHGDYLIDDRLKYGAEDFPGKHIHFGTEAFPNWESVLDYL